MPNRTRFAIATLAAGIALTTAPGAATAAEPLTLTPTDITTTGTTDPGSAATGSSPLGSVDTLRTAGSALAEAISPAIPQYFCSFWGGQLYGGPMSGCYRTQALRRGVAGDGHR